MRSRLANFFENLIGSGSSWGLLRAALVLVVLFFAARLLRWFWAESNPRDLALWWPGGWRFWLPGIAALLAGLLAVTNYTNRLYQLPLWSDGWRYLLANTFGIGLAMYEAKDGKLLDAQGEEVDNDHAVRRTGGSFSIRVRPGSAVVLESLDRPTRVLGAGMHTVSRLDRIREVISLADQTWEQPSVLAMSKDGIQVNVQRIRYRYRLQPGRQPMDYHKRVERDPYPFTDKAAQALAYNRTVMADGQLTPWDNAVRLAVEGVVTDEINANWFDEVTAPRHTGANHRDIMIENMWKRGLRNRLRGVGTDLVWFDIGNFAAARPEVLRQRVETWGSKRSGQAGVEKAEGEAYRTSAMQHGRIDAQVEVLDAIMRAMDETRSVPLDLPQMLDLFLLRTTQLLETMREASTDAPIRKLPDQPASVTMQRLLGAPPAVVAVDEEHTGNGHGSTHVRITPPR